MYITSMVHGSSSINLAFPLPFDDDEEKSPESSMATELQALLQSGGRPRDSRREFAEYIADPSRSFPSFPRFARRKQGYGFSVLVVLNLVFCALAAQRVVED